MNSIDRLEIDCIECDFCQEAISGEIIKPCRCDKYYHKTCIQHLTHVSDDPLVFQKCEQCNSDYKTKYKNIYAMYIYKYFSYHSRKLYYNYSGSGLLGLIIDLSINRDLNSVFSGLTLGCLSYLSLLWISVIIVINLYHLTDKIQAYLFSSVSVLLLVLNLYIQEHWLEAASIALSGAILVKSKKYLFVLSSYYPYLIIENYYQPSKLQAII